MARAHKPSVWWTTCANKGYVWVVNVGWHHGCMHDRVYKCPTPGGCRIVVLSRSHHCHWHHDQQLPHQPSRSRRPRNPPALCSQPMGKTVCTCDEHTHCVQSSAISYVPTTRIHNQPHLLWHTFNNRQQLVDTLESGTTIIADRYSYSGVAFSAAKGLDKGWCEAQEVGLPAPDAVFYLSLSLDEAAGRGGFGEERYEKRDMQEKVCLVEGETCIHTQYTLMCTTHPQYINTHNAHRCAHSLRHGAKRVIGGIHFKQHRALMHSRRHCLRKQPHWCRMPRCGCVQRGGWNA